MLTIYLRGDRHNTDPGNLIHLEVSYDLGSDRVEDAALAVVTLRDLATSSLVEHLQRIFAVRHFGRNDFAAASLITIVKIDLVEVEA